MPALDPAAGGRLPTGPARPGAIYWIAAILLSLSVGLLAAFAAVR